LATIRRLLIEEGFEGLAVRRIAESSGRAVQTIYNLVGPRDLAITEAISEYSQYVMLSSMPDPNNPNASLGMIDLELQSIELHPEFCRNVCLIYFTEARGIFYDFRARQVVALHSLLAQQQKLGIIFPNVDTRMLAENFILFAGSLFIDWADSVVPFEQLRKRLNDCYSSLMAEAIIPSSRRAKWGS
jgi:AcrR family transcriptional regulator